MGNFAEARRRLIAKIEGCEETHQEMLRTTLASRGVPVENYCRLNVEVGVGEFGMNEWDRLADISMGTRSYLLQKEVQQLVYNAAVRIAKIELTKRRLETHSHGRRQSRSSTPKDLPPAPAPSSSFAVELPAEDVPVHSSAIQHHTTSQKAPFSSQNVFDSQDKFMVIQDEVSSRGSSEVPYRDSTERRRNDSPPQSVSPRRNGEAMNYGLQDAPPRPPKTPMSEPERLPQYLRPNRNPRLPYPDTDGPPPIVNKLRKPEFSAR